MDWSRLLTVPVGMAPAEPLEPSKESIASLPEVSEDPTSPPASINALSTLFRLFLAELHWPEVPPFHVESLVASSTFSWGRCQSLSRVFCPQCATMSPVIHGYHTQLGSTVIPGCRHGQYFGGENDTSWWLSMNGLQQFAEYVHGLETTFAIEPHTVFLHDWTAAMQLASQDLFSPAPVADLPKSVWWEISPAEK
jgi:hypothetical protein